MNPKIVFALALVAIVSQVDAACLCNFGEGVDMCGGSNCQPMVVRPAVLPKVNMQKPRIVCEEVAGYPGFEPVGDLCSCRQTIVVPAMVPRPKCPCKPKCYTPPPCYKPAPPSCYCKAAPLPPPTCACPPRRCSCPPSSCSCSSYPVSFVPAEYLVY